MWRLTAQLSSYPAETSRDGHGTLHQCWEGKRRQRASLPKSVRKDARWMSCLIEGGGGDSGPLKYLVPSRTSGIFIPLQRFA